MKSSALLGATALSFVLAAALASPDADARPPRWKSVTISVTCEGVEPALCRGVHGLTVNADGTYTVGPEPGGTAINDSLSAEDLASIGRHAEALARTRPTTRPVCDKGPTNPGTNQVVTLTTAAGKTLTVYQASVPGKGARCTVGNRSKAIELSATLSLLLTLHYPLPFPPG